MLGKAVGRVEKCPIRPVAFYTSKNEISLLVAWNYADREARKGYWNIVIADRY